ncbi:MAG: hypothetical protein M3041_10680 [Acidobacteriota bacterium]|nr:hypothetical protein [Acidobacteriota bacterium]
MYERRSDKLLTTRQFASRVAQHGGFVIVAVAAALLIGMSGYHWISGLPWLDAFLEASMILGGMGPVHELRTSGAKLFAGIYALFAGLFFIGASGVLLAPFLHRMIHLFHLDKGQK